jgi:hypothetical protein
MGRITGESGSDLSRISGEVVMPKKVMPVSAIPEGFALTQTTMEFVAQKYPAVQLEDTLERFVETALANGWMYADWQAAFRTCVRKGVDNGWNSIVRFKQGKAQDPRWIPVLSEVKPYGFREPQPQETPDSYRTAFNLWKTQQKRTATVMPFEMKNVLKGMG